MRLVDFALRQGHLSERALAEAILAGGRPAHLDRCDVCGARAIELSQWLDQVREAAVVAADQAFPPERLTAQHAQILHRLEQLDEPARVIAFPNHYRSAQPAPGAHRVAAAWIGVAAAAGLFVGAIGGHVTARIENRHLTAQVPVAAPNHASFATAAPPDMMVDPGAETSDTFAAYFERDPESTPQVIQVLDDNTPKIIASR